MNLVYCDGENDQILIESAKCTLPLSVLKASPYSIDQSRPIQFKVSTINSVGESAESEVGGEAVSATAPDAPVNLARDYSLTSTTSITFTWEDPAFNGDLPILDYQVSFDQSSGVY